MTGPEDLNSFIVIVWPCGSLYKQGMEMPESGTEFLFDSVRSVVKKNKDKAPWDSVGDPLEKFMADHKPVSPPA